MAPAVFFGFEVLLPPLERKLVFPPVFAGESRPLKGE
jgi:hypothetical protein